MAWRTCATALPPEAAKVAGAPRSGSVQCGNGPRSRCRSRSSGSSTAVGGGPRLRTGGTTQVHRLRTVRLAALLVGLAMVAAGCGGGGGDEGGDSGGGTAQIKPGGTLNYAADQEPT